MPKNLRLQHYWPLRNIFLFAHVFYHVLLFLFTINNECIQKRFSKSLFAFTIPFTFSEIMKALVLVEDLSTTGF